LGAPAFVTQNGEHLNLVTETGDSYRAWPDWSAPGSRIWIDARDEGAVYSPDGIRIQFDDGRVWQRDIVPPPPVVFRRAPVIYSR
jgi:Tol biopolymer transport system component